VTSTLSAAQIARLCHAIGVNPGMMDWVLEGKTPEAKRLRFIQLKEQVRVSWRKKAPEVSRDAFISLSSWVRVIQKMDAPQDGAIPTDLRHSMTDAMRVGWRWAQEGWATAG
jgi:hypothetical protein